MKIKANIQYRPQWGMTMINIAISHFLNENDYVAFILKLNYLKKRLLCSLLIAPSASDEANTANQLAKLALKHGSELALIFASAYLTLTKTRI